MRVLACPDKFRGSLTASRAAEAIAAAVGEPCVRLPLADGGEGTLDALGGGNRIERVTGPLGAPLEAAWRLDADGTAVVEAALACGWVLVGGADGNDPMSATTRGVGELIVAALRAGAKRVLVGVGGSATTDGGAGAVAALDEAGLSATAVEVCCDVRTPFTRAAVVFGPQKGASAQQVELLSARLDRLREEFRERSGLDLDQLPGSGASGGLAGGLAALGARLAPGFDAIAAHAGLDEALAGVDLVVTGEGRLDATSFEGKVVGGVLERARAAGLAAVVVCGAAEVDPRVPVLDLSASFGRERAFADATACIAAGLPDLLRGL